MASKGKVLVAMSGGVDSSVAAAMLQRDGYEVVGCFMRLGSDDSLEAEAGYDNIREAEAACKQPRSHKQGCCSVNDAADARLVAAILGVPFYVMNFKKDFGRIIDYFVDEYNAGRTPNPCVRCNDWLKFGKLHDYAANIDCDFVASGHYAQVLKPGDGHPPALIRGLDQSKDQSYVLFGTPIDRLNLMLLPIGGMEKSRVRDLADEWGLPTFDKPDSQEICFVPDQDYAKLVERRTEGGFERGAVLTEAGEQLGEHDGHQHFTLGQRRGLGVALGYPIYVVDKDPAANTVTVGPKAALRSSGCTADQTNWLVPTPSDNWQRAMVKFRYNTPAASGRFRVTEPDELEIEFDEPAEAVTPGQAVVCYGGEDFNRVLGGGWINKVERLATDQEPA
jgi:tRNA-specific 2-thiouridylase